MFHFQDIPAFILRFAIFFLNFTTYPLLTYFVNNMLVKGFCRHREVNRRAKIIVNFTISFIPLVFALIYPNIGTVLSYAGAISGFLIIYVFPVLVHLKNEQAKINNPILNESIEIKESNNELRLSND